MDLWVLLLFVSSAQSSFPVTVENFVGEQLLRQLQDDIVNYGPCWQSAVENLRNSCAALTEDGQHLMALEFTSCFVQKLGVEGYSCKGKMSECEDYKRLSSSPHLSTYSTFFTHTQIICHFLQQQRWHGNTVKLIGELSSTSGRLATKLNEINEAMEDTRDDQGRLQELTKSAILANQDLASKITSQGSSMTTMLEQIQYVNGVIAGHASTLSSFAYFVGGVVISFLLTAPEQTRQVRPWLLLLFTTNLLIELAILQWALEFAGYGSEYFTNSANPVNFRLIVVRRLFVCISFVMYLYKALTYRSIQDQSHGILLQLTASVSTLDARLGRIESALTQAASRVKKTYDNIDGYSDTPVRYRLSTPLRATKRSDEQRKFEEDQSARAVLSPADIKRQATPSVCESVDRTDSTLTKESVRRSSRLRSPAC